MGAITLPLCVRQELSIKGQHDAIAIGVLLFVNVDLAVDHGHNPVSKFLMDDSLYGMAVNKHALEETIYHGVSWRDGTDPAIRIPARAELRDQPFGRVPPRKASELEEVKEGVQFILVRFSLPVEQRGDPNLVLVHRLGYLLKCKASTGFSKKEYTEGITWLAGPDAVALRDRLWWTVDMA